MASVIQDRVIIVVSAGDSINSTLAGKPTTEARRRGDAEKSWGVCKLSDIHWVISAIKESYQTYVQNLSIDIVLKSMRY
jgi:hypothetical protein